MNHADTPDLLVIGGGLAGAVAAAVARAAGARVMLVRRAWGATALSSGAIDGLAPDPDALGTFPPGAVTEARALSLAGLLRRQPRHPLARVGAGALARIDAELAGALEVVTTLLAGRPGALAPGSRQTGLYVTALGTLQWALAVQAGMAAGELAHAAPGRVAVADIPDLPDWDAPAIVATLNATHVRGLPAAVPVPLTLPVPARRGADLARSFDRLECNLRVTLPAGGDWRVLLLPPVCGTHDVAARLARWSAALGIPCAETLAETPSVPGFRLQTSIDAALADRGVELILGEVTRDPASGALCVHDRRLLPRATVLATGRFLGGGIRRDTEFRESVFDLPVSVGGVAVRHHHPLHLTQAAVDADQSLLSVGVTVDDSGRASGSPAPIFPAGAVVADWSWPGSGGGLAIAALLGMRAAVAALRSLSPGVPEHAQGDPA